MTTATTQARPRWTLRGTAAVTALVTVAGVLFRQAGVPRYRTVWAEDGQVFGQCAFTDPSPATCVLQGYDGWLHVVPRVLAWAASAFPPELFSYAVTGAAALVTGAAAVLVAHAVSDASRQPAGSILAGASLALVLPAGAEAGGNLANLHWILFVAAVAVICCTAIGHRFDRWDAGLVLLTALSSPFGMLLLVLLIGASIAGPADARPGGRLVLATLAISATQLAIAFVSPRNELPDVAVTLLSPVGWLLDQLYRRGPFGARSVIPGFLVGAAATLAFGALLAVTARRARVRSAGSAAGGDPWWAPWRAPLAIVALGGACAAVFAASTYLNRHDTSRYDLIPMVGLVIALVLTTSLLATSLGRVHLGGRSIELGSAASAVVALVLAVGFATTFRLSNAASSGPSYPAAFRDAAATCDAGQTLAVIGISPLARGSTTPTWHLAIPCERIRR